MIIDYLFEEDLIIINHYMILKYGGYYAHIAKNVLNLSSFHYVLEIVRAEIFGENIYPSIYDKAAAYAFYIIKDHVFYDGNKRTGCESAFIFLANNGIEIDREIAIEKVVELGINIENSSLNVKDIALWLEENSNPVLTI